LNELNNVVGNLEQSNKMLSRYYIRMHACICMQAFAFGKFYEAC